MNAVRKTCRLALLAVVLVTPIAYRLLLRMLMTTHGFNPYSQEWWHFTVAGELYPDTCFDFRVEWRGSLG